MVAVPPPQRVLAVAVCTLGQMLAKLALYAVARWLPQRLPVRARNRLERASEEVRRVEKAGWPLILVSAAVGIPPFYAISLVAGATGVNLVAFSVAGIVGRAARFAVLGYSAVAASGALEIGL